MRAEAGITVDPGLSVVGAHALSIAAHHRLVHDVPKHLRVEGDWVAPWEVTHDKGI